MKKILIGHSGFVGSNLVEQTLFDAVYNSKNIGLAFYTNPDICVYSGIRAEKFLANSNGIEDLEMVNNAIENINKINPKFLILISTIDVYFESENKNEDYEIPLTGLEPYGKNRLILEKWVESNLDNYLIVRLPALFGKNIKKNFIYDYIYRIPKMLKEPKFNQLALLNSEMNNYYMRNANGFYECKALSDEEVEKLRRILIDLNFSALNFTDSRSSFQFYNLAHLWCHIEIAMRNNIKKINLVSEPISASMIYQYLSKSEFENHILKSPLKYNLKTKYDVLFNGSNGYIFNKEFILNEITEFVRGLI